MAYKLLVVYEYTTKANHLREWGAKLWIFALGHYSRLGGYNNSFLGLKRLKQFNHLTTAKTAGLPKDYYIFGQTRLFLFDLIRCSWNGFNKRLCEKQFGIRW